MVHRGALRVPSRRGRTDHEECTRNFGEDPGEVLRAGYRVGQFLVPLRTEFAAHDIRRELDLGGSVDGRRVLVLELEVHLDVLRRRDSFEGAPDRRTEQLLVLLAVTA